MKTGSLFTGYGGLDMAAAAAFGAKVAWVSDIDAGACKVLAHRYPDVPNLGDITAIDWDLVEPVDIITGGSPCQDLSHAGRRAGMTEGTRSNLWVAMREAIAHLRPTYVIWENVRGAYSACAQSEADRSLGPCPRCLDASSRAGHAPNLRALGRVLGDLSDLGYDAEWRGLQAADVGAPHGRFRVFVVARLADAVSERGDERRIAGPEEAASRRASAVDRGRDRAPLTLLGTPRAAEGMKHNLRTGVTDPRGRLEDQVALLLPTPAVNDMGKAYTPEEWDDWTDKMKAVHGNGNGHGKSLEIEAARLMPTPISTDANGARNSTSGRRAGSKHHSGDTLGDLVYASRFGEYAAAITRWESVTGLLAPDPTEPTGKGGAHRLSPRFVEWMMGLPAGWITDVPDITRNEALKLGGNGVVQQQAYAAIIDCRAAFAEVVAA